MPIKGLSDRRRLPRSGVIRLGIKKKSEKSGKEYPVETDYFVCPELIREVYGPEPKELLVMFPVEREEIFFQQFYKCYGKGILLCRGDGNEGTFWDFDKGDFNTRECPCEKLEKGGCKPIGILQFLLPEVKESGGVWQITTSSKNSIIDINSGIDFVRGIAGRVAMIPLLLKREAMETQRIEGNGIKKGTHFTLKLSLGMSLADIQMKGLLPPTQALIPAPDETQAAADDLFPPNGFKDDEEKNGKDQEPDPMQDIADEQGDMPDQKEAYRTITLKLSNGKYKKVDKFEALKYFQKIKKEIGGSDYYAVLGGYGYEKSNQVPESKVPEVYAKMIETWETSKESREAKENGQKNLI